MLAILAQSTLALAVAPTINSVASGDTGAVNLDRLSWAHTVAAGSNKYMVVGVSLLILNPGAATFERVAPGRRVTFDGAPPPSSERRISPARPSVRMELWGLVDPVGNHNVVVTLAGEWSRQHAHVGGSVAYNGVDRPRRSPRSFRRQTATPWQPPPPPSRSIPA